MVIICIADIKTGLERATIIIVIYSVTIVVFSSTPDRAAVPICGISIITFFYVWQLGIHEAITAFELTGVGATITRAGRASAAVAAFITQPAALAVLTISSIITFFACRPVGDSVTALDRRAVHVAISSIPQSADGYWKMRAIIIVAAG